LFLQQQAFVDLTSLALILNLFSMFQLRKQEAITWQREDELKTSHSEITSLLAKVCVN
jgi:hypothetical protein